MSVCAISYAEKTHLLPTYGWRKRFDECPPKNAGPNKLRFGILMSNLPDIPRYIIKSQIPTEYRKKRLLPIDILNPLTVPSTYGVPLGGIGCGTIGRGYKGEFCRSSLIPGRFNYDVGVADQFILTVWKDGTCVYHQVLSTSGPAKGVQGLHSWKWSMSPQVGNFIGLYPRSWTVYEFPELKLLLICKQVSPVIPEDYKDSCLPIGVFHWTALNFDPESDVKLSITMTWRGPRAPKRPLPPKVGAAGAVCAEIGHLRKHKDDEFTFPFDDSDNQLSGCLLETFIDDMPCCFGVAAKSTDKVEVSRCMGFTLGCKGAGSASSKQKTTGKESYRSPWGITTHSMASAHDAISSSKLWTDLGQEGHLAFENTGYYVERKDKNHPLIGVAVCASFKVVAAAGGKDDLVPGQEACDFFLTWHMPRVHFRSALVAYRRRYVRWFSEDIIRGASELLIYASRRAHLWDEAIESWQSPILQDSRFPTWYKSALFNELYYIADGGTVWLDPLPAEGSAGVIAEGDGSAASSSNGVTGGTEELCSPLENVRRRNPTVRCRRPAYYSTKAPAAGDNAPADVAEIELIRARVNFGNEMGLFAYLEGHEYRLYNTYDVHFNASWALLKLWPRLQLAINYDLADMTASEDRSPMKPVFRGTHDKHRILSYALSVPHDCGDPEDEPWYRVNAYTLRATDEWKDLNPKFVLMTWRDWKVTGDDDYLFYMLPLIVAIMEGCLEKWDKDEDGIIESANFPDQTYDMWKAVGLGAYIGSIWLAALYATKDMISYTLSKEQNPVKNETLSGQEHKFGELLSKAKTNYYEKLWNGCFYRYDMHDSKANPAIMADQICGHWLLRTCGAPADAILPENTIPLTIDSVVSKNWRSVLDGEMGAINGVRKNGKVVSNVQAEEFWVGTNYCLASLFILEGMPINGFDLGGACYKTVYENLGLQYQTPEAYTMEKGYRSPAYMRPLSIWSIQHSADLRHLCHNGSSPARTTD
ncbi:Non-lysosomal glucosylceramidase [Echinococcus granulosus]|uniref:Non-lysosomal glucosylceramidase n=1 Tax=Echinococcus granulosus TaxID=6210 RepID=W6UBE4_ECHGR|nr:Non-lysosomal glucosylceramidase [Echinococcus granulosus]EUB58430.1 Non-lysosomal glucosylceramidase [Echinococcus granulosus]